MEFYIALEKKVVGGGKKKKKKKTPRETREEAQKIETPRITHNATANHRESRRQVEIAGETGGHVDVEQLGTRAEKHHRSAWSSQGKLENTRRNAEEAEEKIW